MYDRSEEAGGDDVRCTVAGQLLKMIPVPQFFDWWQFEWLGFRVDIHY